MMAKLLSVIWNRLVNIQVSVENELTELCYTAHVLDVFVLQLFDRPCQKESIRLWKWVLQETSFFFHFLIDIQMDL